jgi:hypothetical protein
MSYVNPSVSAPRDQLIDKRVTGDKVGEIANPATSAAASICGIDRAGVSKGVPTVSPATAASRRWRAGTAIGSVRRLSRSP